MIFSELPLAGSYLIRPEPIEDERGFFARLLCREQFLKVGLDFAVEQSSLSFNKLKGTLRGMHYQEEPYSEVKIVQCLRGAMYDVILDLRPSSPTYQQWTAVMLDAAQHQMIYIPKGVAHGFQTLEDNTEVLYQISTAYVPGASRGVRWDDPSFKIEWPLRVSVISQKDMEYRLLTCLR